MRRGKKGNMKRISYDEFVREFASNGYTLQDTRIILKDFEETLYRVLKRGDSVRLTGFLDFDMYWIDAKYRRCPRTGEYADDGCFRIKIHPGFRMKNVLLSIDRERFSDNDDSFQADCVEQDGDS